MFFCFSVQFCGPRSLHEDSGLPLLQHSHQSHQGMYSALSISWFVQSVNQSINQSVNGLVLIYGTVSGLLGQMALLSCFCYALHMRHALQSQVHVLLCFTAVFFVFLWPQSRDTNVPCQWQVQTTMPTFQMSEAGSNHYANIANVSGRFKPLC